MPFIFDIKNKKFQLLSLFEKIVDADRGFETGKVNIRFSPTAENSERKTDFGFKPPPLISSVRPTSTHRPLLLSFC